MKLKKVYKLVSIKRTLTFNKSLKIFKKINLKIKENKFELFNFQHPSCF